MVGCADGFGLYVIAAAILGILSVLLLMVFVWQQGRALRSAQSDARRAAFVAGQAVQALADAANHPMVDTSSRAALSVALHEVRTMAKPLMLEERNVG